MKTRTLYIVNVYVRVRNLNKNNYIRIIRPSVSYVEMETQSHDVKTVSKLGLNVHPCIESVPNVIMPRELSCHCVDSNSAGHVHWPQTEKETVELLLELQAYSSVYIYSSVTDTCSIRLACRTKVFEQRELICIVSIKIYVLLLY